MISSIMRQWFLGALAAVLAVGWWLAQLESTTGQTHLLLRGADHGLLRKSVVAGVLFLMAWPLPTTELLRTLQQPWPAVLASLINVGLLPLLAFPLSKLGHPDLSLGLIVTAATPCTLASAAVWTRRAGGNDATAILVTLITNSTCFLVAPFWLVLLTGQAIRIPVQPMVIDLAALVVLPMTIAQLLRFHNRTGEWATRHRISLAYFAQLGILWMVFVGAVSCGRSLYALQANSEFNPTAQLTVTDTIVMLVQVVVLHLLGWSCGWWVSRMVGFPRADQIAVGFAGSQKTLMVGLQIAVFYYGGLTILPMLAYHVLQLLIDTLIADRLRRGAPVKLSH